MSDTEQLFIVAAVWALIAAVIARFIPNWPGRIAFFAIAVALPFWELPYGYYNFEKLCKEQAGLKTFEPIQPQRFVCVAYPFDSGAPFLLKAGFSVVEARDKTGNVNRISRAPSGEFESAKLNRVTSEYCITYAFVRGLPWRVMRNEMTVSRESDQKLVARHSEFVWFGMWWQEAATPVLGRGGQCRGDAIQPISTALLGGVK
jgi:hypothetical protein